MKLALLTIIFATFLGIHTQAVAHCQVPCGIYDDNLRIKTLLEDALTIEKAVSKIHELEKKTDIQSQHQRIRWVINKEEHAQKIIETISNYFLTQRVKPSQKNYSERLKKHHAVILAAMKAKQNSDSKTPLKLIKEIKSIEAYYPPHKH